MVNLGSLEEWQHDQLTALEWLTVGIANARL